MSIASIHLELSRLSLCSPIALETLLEAGSNVRALCSSPLALALVGNFVFQAGSQAGKAPTAAQEASTGIPTGWEGAGPVALSDSANPCPWLLPHLCEHHTALPGDRGPFSKSQVVP